jgi:arginase family enzyme
MSIFKLQKNGTGQYQRGYENGKDQLSRAASQEEIDRIWNSFEVCQIGDDYDRGYRKALDEHKEAEKASKK